MNIDDIIVDVSNLYYRAYHTHKDLVYEFPQGKGKLITGGVYGFLQSINKLSRIYTTTQGRVPKFWFLFDNHDSKINNRKLIDPDYKKNRVKQSSEFYRGIDYLEMVLMHHSDGNVIINRTEWEADDLVKPVVYEIDSSHTILLYSQDLDYSRLIEHEGRKIFWDNAHQIFDKKVFRIHYGFTPTESSVTLYKTFKGDPSDAIPNAVPNLPKEVLFQIMEAYKDLYKFLQDLPIIWFLSDHWKRKIQEAIPRLILNEQLVSFIGIGKEQLKDSTFETRYSPHTLKTLYESIGFNIDKIDRRLAESLKQDTTYIKGWTDLI